MVNIYNLVDFIFLVILVYFTYISYKNKIYLKIFEYFKLFVIISLSAKLSSTSAIILQDLHITKADTYTTLILISFVLNFMLMYHFYKYITKFINKFISSEKIKEIFAKLFTFVEVLTLLTFSIYIIMQIYIVKVYFYKGMKKTYSYPKIQKFYKSFLNDNFINMIIKSDTGTNYKEVIFKSFKNSI